MNSKLQRPSAPLGLLLLTATLAGAAEPLTLHVATNGNDGWSGRLAAPNADRTDGPLASLARARDAIRGTRGAAACGSRAVTVQVHGGAYRLEAPFVLEPRDSGSAEAPVVFAAFGSERPVLSGGRVLTGFRQNGPLCRFYGRTFAEWQALGLDRQSRIADPQFADADQGRRDGDNYALLRMY